MTSIAPSKWSMSVRSDDRILLKLKLHVRRYYYVLALPIIALYTLILCGCISSTTRISEIFLAELRNDSTLLRFGYFGICTSPTESNHYRCTSAMFSTSNRIASKLSAPQELTNYAIDLQRSISFITPSISGVLFFLGLINLGVLQILHLKRRPALISKSNQALDKHIRNVTLATRILLWTSTAISLAAAHSMHSNLAALQVATSSTYGRVEGGTIIRGGAMEAMLWSIFALSVLFNIILQLTTTLSEPIRMRRSTFLPFAKTNAEERETSIRKITTATAQRLAVIGNRHDSEQSMPMANSNTPIYASMAHKPSDFEALNSPTLQTPPLATLQRRPTNPNPTRPKPSPLSLAWPNDQQTPLSPISFLNSTPVRSSPRRIEVREHTQHELRQISPGLQGILSREGRYRGTSSIYSRPATSPRGAGKSAWV